MQAYRKPVLSEASPHLYRETGIKKCWRQWPYLTVEISWPLN